ncbi:MAG: VOC family protein [Desulfobacteraceae bacterium]|nr:MAG: VOC family protein [Desulfobacteraceae bacterium]
MEEHLTKHGMISWSELMTSNLEAARKFYAQLFGWELERAPMQEMDYIMVKSNGREIAGMMATPPGAEATPPNWGIYITVEDVDAAARKAQELGATVCVPPRDIPQVGRFCVLQDPQGAFFSIITYLR